jgi:hypothetical protein
MVIETASISVKLMLTPIFGQTAGLPDRRARKEA